MYLSDVHLKQFLAELLMHDGHGPLPSASEDIAKIAKLVRHTSEGIASIAEQVTEQVTGERDTKTNPKDEEEDDFDEATEKDPAKQTEEKKEQSVDLES